MWRKKSFYSEVEPPHGYSLPLAQHAEFGVHLEEFMKKISTFRLHQKRRLGFLAFTVFMSSAVLATRQGEAVFTAENGIYVGTYSESDKLIAVDIDGQKYKGYYAAHAQDMGRDPATTPAGTWGRAFLFASSAKVLRCALDAEFPRVSGQCVGADGRYFQLTPETLQKNAPAPKLSATK